MEKIHTGAKSLWQSVRGVVTGAMAAAVLSIVGVAAQADNGDLVWRGNVDDVTRIVVRGGTVEERVVSGRGTTEMRSRMDGSRIGPNDRVSLSDVHGRGQVRIVQYPDRRNGFTSIVEVRDSQGGSAPYSFRLNWNSGRADEQREERQEDLYQRAYNLGRRDRSDRLRRDYNRYSDLYNRRNVDEFRRGYNAGYDGSPFRP